MKCPKCHFDNPDDTRFCGNCAAPLPPSEEIPLSKTETLRATMKELTIGSTFAGRYQVIEELGKGGMGSKIYQKKGWVGKAIEHYDKFLHLWKDANPGIPELDDAKKQLAALQTE